MGHANDALTKLGNSQPILRVEDMSASLRFYVDLLGFKSASWGTEDFTSVNRDRAGIYLCQRGQGHAGGWAWIAAEDVAELHQEFIARGVTIRLPPTNYPWSLEMHIEDPDGNVIRFGSDPLTTKEFEQVLTF